MRRGAPRAVSLTMVWLTLSCLTLLSVMLVEQGGWRRAAIVAIFGIAGIKIELVFAYYMEIGRALAHWRVAYRLWFLGVTGLLVAAHLIG